MAWSHHVEYGRLIDIASTLYTHTSSDNEKAPRRCSGTLTHVRNTHLEQEGERLDGDVERCGVNDAEQHIGVLIEHLSISKANERFRSRPPSCTVLYFPAHLFLHFVRLIEQTMAAPCLHNKGPSINFVTRD